MTGTAQSCLDENRRFTPASTYVVIRSTTHVFSDAAAPSGASINRRTGSGGLMPGVRGDTVEFVGRGPQR